MFTVSTLVGCCLLYGIIALSCFRCFHGDLQSFGSSYQYLTAPQRCGVMITAFVLAALWPTLPAVATVLWVHDVLRRHDAP